MTQGERILYEALWHCRETNGIGKFKTFSLGYDRIARIASVDEKTVRVSVPRLISKRVLDLLAAENSATRTGRTYRIYSYEGILERQRAAGMTSIIKNGKAVEFVWTAGTVSGPPTMGGTPAVGATPTVGVLPTVVDAPSVGGTPTVGAAVASPLSPADLTTFRSLARIIQEAFGSPIDDLLLRSLIDNCHRNSTATVGEPASEAALMYFVSAKASEICRQPNTLYPKKVLAKAVAECFLGETYRVYVEDAIAQQHEETERTARQARDADLRAQEMAEQEARHARWEQICENHKTEQGYDMKAIAEDPDLNERGREVACEMIRRVGRFSQIGL
jgi:hypothetical protein